MEKNRPISQWMKFNAVKLVKRISKSMMKDIHSSESAMVFSNGKIAKSSSVANREYQWHNVFHCYPCNYTDYAITLLGTILVNVHIHFLVRAIQSELLGSATKYNEIFKN